MLISRELVDFSGGVSAEYVVESTAGVTCGENLSLSDCYNEGEREVVRSYDS